MTDDDLDIELDNDRTRIIWVNVLECIDNDSTDALEAARDFANRQDNPEFELHMLFTVTAGLLSRFLLRELGEDRMRQMIGALLHDLELDAYTASLLDEELQRLLEPGDKS